MTQSLIIKTNQPRGLRARWTGRPRLPKFRDMPQWAQGVCCCLGGVESAYWWSKVHDIAPYVERSADHAFFSVATFATVTVLGLLAMQACFFTGMALQCGKYLQEKLFE